MPAARRIQFMLIVIAALHSIGPSRRVVIQFSVEETFACGNLPGCLNLSPVRERRYTSEINYRKQFDWCLFRSKAHGAAKRCCESKAS
jgi:hypothetical protein